ncbi:MAG: Histidine kinase, gyrase and HSP90-like ATPase, partial [Bacteroidota bacterium]
LSIVKELVLLLNGNIQIQSDINQGTTFTVILPLNPEDKVEKITIKDEKSDEIIQQKTENNTTKISIQPEIINQLKNKKVLLIHKDILTAFDFVNILNSNKIEVYLATDEYEIDEIVNVQKIDTKLQYIENKWVITELNA